MHASHKHTTARMDLKYVFSPRTITRCGPAQPAPGEAQAASALERSPKSDRVTELLVDQPRVAAHGVVPLELECTHGKWHAGRAARRAAQARVPARSQSRMSSFTVDDELVHSRTQLACAFTRL